MRWERNIWVRRPNIGPPRAHAPPPIGNAQSLAPGHGVRLAYPPSGNPVRHRVMAQSASRPVSDFVRHHFRHFNAAALIDAADGYTALIDGGGRMFMTLAGAMSTAELGLSLAEMIRQGKVHGISCTGANLEEDLFNLVAHDHYARVPHYRQLTPADEKALLD